MQLATDLSFTKRLCAAYDLNRGSAPADGAERVRRSEVIEYIEAYSVEKRPSHPTKVIAWDLQRTFGELEGRRLLLYASRQWDAKPLRAREVVRMWWDDDYQPQAWRDEYLVDIIDDWRWQRARVQLCADAERDWLAFNGMATLPQMRAWREKYGPWYPGAAQRLGRVSIVSAEQAKFAADMRAGRVPNPSAPREERVVFKPRLGPVLLGRKGRR